MLELLELVQAVCTQLQEAREQAQQDSAQDNLMNQAQQVARAMRDVSEMPSAANGEPIV